MNESTLRLAYIRCFLNVLELTTSQWRLFPSMWGKKNERIKILVTSCIGMYKRKRMRMVVGTGMRAGRLRR